MRFCYFVFNNIRRKILQNKKIILDTHILILIILTELLKLYLNMFIYENILNIAKIFQFNCKNTFSTGIDQ